MTIQKQTIICFGDSLTACGGKEGRYSDILQDRFPDHEFINRGVGGETFEEAISRLETDVLDLAPDLVLVEFGANDWWRDDRPYQAWTDELEYCIQRIQGIGAKVMILGVFGLYRDQDGNLVEKIYGIDERAVAYREEEERLAEKYQCHYVSNIQQEIIENRCCWRDRNHPNEYGNRYVADMIEPYLEEILEVKAVPDRKPSLQTLRDIWHEAIALGANQTAVICEGQRLTYGEADAKVKQLAAGIADASGVASPKVAVFLPNCLNYYLIYWAVVELGGAIVPLNTWLKKDSLKGILANIKPDLVITQNLNHAPLTEALNSAADTTVATMDGDGDGVLLFDDLFSDTPYDQDVEVDPDQGAIIMHTSGTTSTPKGAVMRHSDLMFNVMTTINAHQFSVDDVHLLVNPMFHCTALYSSLPTAAYQKTPVVITADTSPDKLMALVKQQKITTFLSTPVIFQNIISLPEIASLDVPSLRLIAYAGSPMPVSTIRSLQKYFPNVDLHNFFGLTETISMTHVLKGEDAEERPDSVGRLLPFVKAMVVDEENVEQPAGKEGILLFARDNIIPGYYNQPDKLQAAIRTINGEEWFDTGDLAVVDDEGYFFIKGRQKDMIIVGGENVYSSEVEAILGTHEHIREAAVKGVPATGARASFGELVKAFVVTDGTELTPRDVRAFCNDKLASYKVPVEVEFLNKLPRNPSGKVVKAEL